MREESQQQNQQDRLDEAILRIEMLHGSIAEEIGERELEPDEVGKLAGYEEALDLLESAREGGFDFQREELSDDDQAAFSNLISASRAWRDK